MIIAAMTWLKGSSEIDCFLPFLVLTFFHTLDVRFRLSAYTSGVVGHKGRQPHHRL